VRTLRRGNFTPGRIGFRVCSTFRLRYGQGQAIHRLRNLHLAAQALARAPLHAVVEQGHFVQHRLTDAPEPGSVDVDVAGRAGAVTAARGSDIPAPIDTWARDSAIRSYIRPPASGQLRGATSFLLPAHAT